MEQKINILLRSTLEVLTSFGGGGRHRGVHTRRPPRGGIPHRHGLQAGAFPLQGR